MSALAALPLWALVLIFATVYTIPLLLGWARSASRGRPVSSEVLTDLLFPVFAGAGAVIALSLLGAVLDLA
ncbi:hypothetical protein ASE03_07445 [Kitasatospora sp. Root187]|nr:hypothetical protein ASC99_12495 [Kitasatospora sp. Root107]KRB62421.1 hypothetical protein ASE03_07445 [Kitasatospora sp. Root187]